MSTAPIMSAELEHRSKPRLRALPGKRTKRSSAAASSGRSRIGAAAVDATMLAVSVAATVSSALVAGVPAMPPAWLLAFALLVLGLLTYRGMYGPPRLDPHFLEDARSVFSATAVATLTVIALRVVLVDNPHIAAQMVTAWAFAALFLSAGRGGIFSARQRAIRRVGGRPTLIVGAGKVGHLLARRLLQRPEHGLKPVGFLDNEPLLAPGEGVPLPVLGASWDLDEVIAERGVQHVIFTFSTAPHGVMLEMIRRCHERGVAVSHVPRLFEAAVERMTVEHLGGLPLVAMRPSDPKSWQFAIKHALDRAASAALLVLSAPLMAAIAIAVRVSLGSPVLFRQNRVGQDGREFEMLKFRTMSGRLEGCGENNADWAHEVITGDHGLTLGSMNASNGGSNGNGRHGAALTDTLIEEALRSGNGRNGNGNGNGPCPPSSGMSDRRTPFGSFLRKFSLDELPQLWNVFRGDMSLIGPRPELPRYVPLFERAVYRYGDRHRVRSGITGWAQVHGLRGRTSLDDRVEWDNYYIENWSLWLDLKIAMMTIRPLLRPKGE